MSASEKGGSDIVAQWMARATWLILPLVFIRLLGGLHPTDEVRDMTVAFTAGLIVGLNVPSVVVLFRHLRTRDSWRVIAYELVGLAARSVFTFVVLRFVAGISHEGH